MPTTNKKFDTPARGSEVGVWDVPVNGNSTKLDNILGGVTNVALSSSNVTLTDDQMRNMMIVFSGTLSANIVVIATMPGFYIIQNNCIGNFIIRMRVSGAGKQIALPPGDPFDAYCDGTDWGFRNLGRTGQMQFWNTTAMPDWVLASTVPPFLMMNGQSFSAATYPALNAFLGINAVQDFSGCVPAPMDGMGGVGATRIGTVPTLGGTINGSVLNSVGGTSLVGLVAANNGPHSHGVNLTDPGHVHLMRATARKVSTAALNVDVAETPLGTGGAGGNTVTATTGISVSIVNNGSGTPHVNMQPTRMAGIFVIKT